MAALAGEHHLGGGGSGTGAKRRTSGELPCWRQAGVRDSAGSHRSHQRLTPAARCVMARDAMSSAHHRVHPLRLRRVRPPRLGGCAGRGGKLVAVFGRAGLVTFWRSAAKPFQALPLVLDGAAERWGFGARELALACASHSSEPGAPRLAEMLRACGCEERSWPAARIRRSTRGGRGGGCAAA